MRSAAAAERANLLTERALEREVLTVRESKEQDVSWRIEHPGGSRYILRNTGTDTALDVTMPQELMGSSAFGLPENRTVRSGEGIEFEIVRRFGLTVPHTAYVCWRGQDDPQAVPMP